MSKPKRNRPGAKRKPGERYANGRLKPPPVRNVVVVRRRAMICKDITKASCPLDAALGNDWITEEQHRAATLFESVARRILAMGPRAPSAMDLSTPSSVIDAKGIVWGKMKSADVTAVWDSAMSRSTGGFDEEGDEKLALIWKQIAASLGHDEMKELHALTIGQDWPQWINQRIMARSLKRRIKAEKRDATDEEQDRIDAAEDPRWEKRFALFVSACEQLRRGMRKDRIDSLPERDGTITPIPGPKVVEREIRVTATGEQVLEVVRIRRKGAA